MKTLYKHPDYQRDAVEQILKIWST